MYERMYKEACWSWGKEFDQTEFEAFLESEEFKKLEMRVEALAFYEASNWILYNKAKEKL